MQTVRIKDFWQPGVDPQLKGRFFGGALLSDSTRVATARTFGVTRGVITTLPTQTVGVREWMPNPTDQGQTGSCAAHTAAKLRHALINRWRDATGQPGIDPNAETFSPLWEYFWTRKLMGTFPKDSGSSMEAMCKAMLQHSAVLDAERPWEAASAEQQIQEDLSNWQPDSANYYGIGSYERVGGRFQDPVQSAIAALQSKFAVAFAIAVYDNFFDSPLAPMPRRGSKLLGLHAVPVCEFVPDPAVPGGGYFAWDGSWGEGYGDQGYGKLSVQYVASRTYTQEMWKLA